jgi:hypothetical protein
MRAAVLAAEGAVVAGAAEVEDVAAAEAADLEAEAARHHSAVRAAVAAARARRLDLLSAQLLRADARPRSAGRPARAAAE